MHYLSPSTVLKTLYEQLPPGVSQYNFINDYIFHLTSDSYAAGRCSEFLSGQRALPRELVEYFYHKKDVLNKNIRDELVPLYSSAHTLQQVNIALADVIRCSKILQYDQDYLMQFVAMENCTNNQTAELIFETLYFAMQTKKPGNRRRPK